MQESCVRGGSHTMLPHPDQLYLSLALPSCSARCAPRGRRRTARCRRVLHRAESHDGPHRSCALPKTRAQACSPRHIMNTAQSGIIRLVLPHAAFRTPLHPAWWQGVVQCTDCELGRYMAVTGLHTRSPFFVLDPTLFRSPMQPHGYHSGRAAPSDRLR